MALVFRPEDGTGLADSNAYISLERFKDLSDLLGFEYSALTAEQIESGLIRATMVLDANFLSRYPGDRAVTGQALEWPRSKAHYIDGEAIPSNVVPKEVELGTLEMFYLTLAGNNPQPVIPAGGNLREERVRVDVIEEHKKYQVQSGIQRDTFTAVEDALARITGGISSLYNITIKRVGGFF